MKCSACTGPFHPATGHAWSERVVLCGPCARSWCAWLKAQLSRRVGKLRFYDHAATSVRAGRGSDEAG